MKSILVDTCIWSLALQGKSPRDISTLKELSKLIHTEKAKIIGPIRQEVLSGYSDLKQFSKLRDKLEFFPNEPIIDDDYVTVAEFSNKVILIIKTIKNGKDFLFRVLNVRSNLSYYCKLQTANYFSS